jgi:hypothetical protein
MSSKDKDIELNDERAQGLQWKLLVDYPVYIKRNLN